VSNFFRGPAIDTFYQVSVHFAKRFQRRRFLKIGQSETRIACGGHFVNVSEPNVQSLERTFYRCFLPSFSSFGWGVSQEKIKMWKVNGRRTTDAKWWQTLTLPLARWAKKVQMDNQRSIKHTYKTKDKVTRTPLKTRDEHRCSGRVSSSCSTSDTSRVNLVTNPVKSHERGKNREVFTTSGTYPWSFVTQIFHNGQPSRGGDSKTFEVMTST
jgi:hypothetical protein